MSSLLDLCVRLVKKINHSLIMQQITPMDDQTQMNYQQHTDEPIPNDRINQLKATFRGAVVHRGREVELDCRQDCLRDVCKKDIV